MDDNDAARLLTLAKAGNERAMLCLLILSDPETPDDYPVPRQAAAKRQAIAQRTQRMEQLAASIIEQN